jgi:hypothetical protein
VDTESEEAELKKKKQGPIAAAAADDHELEDPEEEEDEPSPPSLSWSICSVASAPLGTLPALTSVSLAMRIDDLELMQWIDLDELSDCLGVTVTTERVARAYLAVDAPTAASTRTRRMAAAQIATIWPRRLHSS